MKIKEIRADLECIVGSRSVAEGETIANVLQRLDQCVRSEPLDERFKHYLMKRSYVKAIAWLDNPEMSHQI